MAAPVTIYTCAITSRQDSPELLRAAVRDWCRRDSRPIPDLTVTRPQYGKPCLRHAPEIQFSVTHSGEYWMCAVSLQKVGLDLQAAQRAQTQKIARRFFHPREAGYLQEHPGDFFKVWSAKESYVKFTGQGIDSSFSDFSVVGTQGLLDQLNGVRLRLWPFCEGYSLCLCCEDTSRVLFVPLTQESRSRS